MECHGRRNRPDGKLRRVIHDARGRNGPGNGNKYKQPFRVCERNRDHRHAAGNLEHHAGQPNLEGRIPPILFGDCGRNIEQTHHLDGERLTGRYHLSGFHFRRFLFCPSARDRHPYLMSYRTRTPTKTASATVTVTSLENQEQQAFPVKLGTSGVNGSAGDCCSGTLGSLIADQNG